MCSRQGVCFNEQVLAAQQCDDTHKDTEPHTVTRAGAGADAGAGASAGASATAGGVDAHIPLEPHDLLVQGVVSPSGFVLAPP